MVHNEAEAKSLKEAATGRANISRIQRLAQVQLFRVAVIECFFVHQKRAGTDTYRALVGAALGRVALHGVHGYAVACRRHNTHHLSRDGLFSVLCSELADSL